MSLIWFYRSSTSGREDAASETIGGGKKEDPKTFIEWVNKINATPAFFENLAAQPDHSPTINLNFPRYRPRGDGDRYNLYGAAAGAGIVGVGGDIAYHGEGITDMNRAFEMSDEWDGEAIYDASSSIAKWHETCTRAPATAENYVVSEFLRFKKPGGREAYEKFAAEFQPLLEAAGGEVMLSVRAEIPIVSEEYWDHFVSFRFPDKKTVTKVYQSDKFHEINGNRIAGLDGTLAVLSSTQIMPAKDCN